MSESSLSKLEQVKNRNWFYEFDLPDGTRTSTDVPEAIRPIHTSRREKLVQIIRDRVNNPHQLTAIDLASHEGYYTIALARHFASVRGYDIRQPSLDGARLITDVLGVTNATYFATDLQTMTYDPNLSADFVLLFGLLYHLENPVHTIRLASQLSRKHILIETQVFPYDISGVMEDGYYANIRRVDGVFGLAPDYPHHLGGGSTDIALVPSLNALLFLLKTFGFADVSVLPAPAGDYEQFVRGSRVIVYGCKP